MFDRLWRFLLVGLSVWLLVLQVGTAHAQAQTAESLVLLLPDTAVLSDPPIQAWLDAAQEEGFHLTVMYDAEFQRLGTAALKYRGIILPDQVHQVASDELVSALENYVKAGGKLMLVYDAGALTSGGFYAIPQSRFSSLVGVSYILYEELRERTIGIGPVTGMESKLLQLQVPPGKSMPFSSTLSTVNATASVPYVPSGPSDPGGMRDYDHRKYHRFRHFGSRGGQHSDDHEDRPTKVIYGQRARAGQFKPKPPTPTDTLQGITGYVYGFLSYPSYVTRPLPGLSYKGEVILTSPDFGLVAGYNSVGKGGVLFVNLPLSYLKGQTDGMLMHGFLRYFGGNLLNLPRLASNPSGVGGLVLNVHLCSEEAIEPLLQLARLRDLNVWERGPFSIHITAGPDHINFGDGLGIDVQNNRTIQLWIKYFDYLNHEVGAHGGWIHDYYGGNASETNQAEFQTYLEANKDAIERVLRRPITEYAAPQGNTPKWSVDWLEDNGFVGYYFTGHTGMAPTRAYREGALLNENIWAFPVTPFGQWATFEEFEENQISASAVANWYTKLVDFSVRNRTSRLIYFHPQGAVLFPEVLRALFARADQHAQSRQYGFHWYTMTDLATFNAKRQQVAWHVVQLSNGSKRFEVSHPTDLAEQTWLLPKASFSKPVLERREQAILAEDADNWLVTAKPRSTVLRFTSAPAKK